MRTLVWIPSRPYEAVEPLWQTLAWAQGFTGNLEWDWKTLRKHEVLTLGDFRSTSLSTSRSAAITTAKEIGAETLIVCDADNNAIVPRDDVFSALAQAWARGYGCVISPAITKSGIVGVHPPDGGAYKSVNDVPTGLFEIGNGTGGFMAFGRSLLEALQPMDYMEANTKQGLKRFANYCHWTENQSEDYSLINHIRDTTKFKVGADTRLRTSHIKFFGIPSWAGRQ